VSEIVVGLDISLASQAALAWAASQARTTGAELRAVHAVQLLPPSAMLASVGWMSAPTSPVGGDRVEEAYRNTVTAMWEMVQPEHSWRLEFYNADPGRLLVAESAHAVLLVIGTREHVGWGRILNGSISHYCLSHAVCPVVAVSPAATPAYEREPRPRPDAGHAGSSTG
jgi:nucleotide-binding universal stress UspA family protein